MKKRVLLAAVLALFIAAGCYQADNSSKTSKTVSITNGRTTVDIFLNADDGVLAISAVEDQAESRESAAESADMPFSAAMANSKSGNHIDLAQFYREFTGKSEVPAEIVEINDEYRSIFNSESDCGVSSIQDEETGETRMVDSSIGYPADSDITAGEFRKYMDNEFKSSGFNRYVIFCDETSKRQITREAITAKMYAYARSGSLVFTGKYNTSEGWRTAKRFHMKVNQRAWIWIMGHLYNDMRLVAEKEPTVLYSRFHCAFLYKR